jgi:uncharacterized OsmC-like protein
LTDLPIDQSISAALQQWPGLKAEPLLRPLPMIIVLVGTGGCTALEVVMSPEKVRCANTGCGVIPVPIL